MKPLTKTSKQQNTTKDSKAKSNNKTHRVKKQGAKTSTKRESKKVLKLLPGQQILSFKPKLIQTKQETMSFLCIDEKSMGWPEQFSNRVIPHHDYDNDQQSNENIVNRQVQNGIASLVQQISFKRIMQIEDTITFLNQNLEFLS